MSSYASFFEAVTGHSPFPYQERLGTEPWPDVVDVPTGLGKTAGVVVAWLWKSLHGDPDTPRRLVYCLPMRVLVDQTSRFVSDWLEKATDVFNEGGVVLPGVHTLMGGDIDEGWRRDPELPAVLVGTQDMLLSRALMRGYGMSRYMWAVDYALLHNDAMWAFDEVQLMGPALPTSAQLDAFRRARKTAKPARSLWLSATLRPEWLATVDFSPFVADLTAIRVSDDDRRRAAERLGARKSLRKSTVSLRETGADATKEYVGHLVAEVVSRHCSASQTLVIVNRVDRAQEIYREIRDQHADFPALLLHARFRASERRKIEAALGERRLPPEGRIVVATQAVEAGVDITSATLFTELAPWSAMVQRFGRCNRYGEITDGATVVWIDLAVEGKDAAPYDEAELMISREILEGGLNDVGPGSLPPVPAQRGLSQVIREKDFLQLFNTDPDLSGFDVDIAPFIRDRGPPQVQVFWRGFEDSPQKDEPKPARDELCPASMGQIRGYLRGRRRAWVWDPLLSEWSRRESRDRIVPGSVLLLRAADGGYDPELGFDAGSRSPVADLGPKEGEANKGYDADDRSTLARWVALGDHLDHVKSHAEGLAEALPLAPPDATALAVAGAWHDVGKAHPAFQTALGDAAEGDGRTGKLWAKSPGKGRLRYRIEAEGEGVERRPYFRHELASMLAWLAHNDRHPDRDLIAFLIAAHHGKVRMGLRALPEEPVPDDGRLIARGIWDGDVLPAVAVDGRSLPATELLLELMQMGRGATGMSWIERTHELLESRGPFQLAWLEALIRVADWRASAEEEQRGHDE